MESEEDEDETAFEDKGMDDDMEFPVTMEEGPASTEKGPAFVEEGPDSTEEGPTSTEEGPAFMEEGPFSTEKGPASTEEGPGLFENAPIEVENSLAYVEETQIDVPSDLNPVEVEDELDEEVEAPVEVAHHPEIVEAGMEELHDAEDSSAEVDNAPGEEVDITVEAEAGSTVLDRVEAGFTVHDTVEAGSKVLDRVEAGSTEQTEVEAGSTEPNVTGPVLEELAEDTLGNLISWGRLYFEQYIIVYYV